MSCGELSQHIWLLETDRMRRFERERDELRADMRRIRDARTTWATGEEKEPYEADRV